MRDHARMPYTEVTGDLFAQGLPAIGHGCNCVGSMGAGIAAEFGRRWPEMYAAYRARCEAGTFRPGGFFAWDAGDVVVYNLATQPSPGPSARVEAIGASVGAALADAASRGIARLGVPRLGAGIGGLAWPDVERVLRPVAEASDVDLVVVTRG
jgi:O-acetyl-ADP-ribose deacetylase (regulator of RNase III)